MRAASSAKEVEVMSPSHLNDHPYDFIGFGDELSIAAISIASRTVANWGSLAMPLPSTKID
jgi:hypothetical protein